MNVICYKELGKITIWDKKFKNIGNKYTNKVISTSHVSAETLKFTYEKNKKGKTVKKQDSTKYTYTYTQKSENPDVYYYEGEDLRIKTVYNTDSHWIETLYFDDGFSIVTEFDDGYKVQETFYINGQEQANLQIL